MIAGTAFVHYLARVPFLRLVRFVAILALLLAPLGMSGGHLAAMAPEPAAASHHEATPAGHCADGAGEDPAGESRPDIDCTISCSALAASAGDLPARAAVRPLPQRPFAVSLARGLTPESDPPPPRAC